jgi:hypothetical protein
MESTLHITTKVLPGSKIEIVDPKLREGDAVDVFLVVNKPASRKHQSVLKIIESLHGCRLFQTPREVDEHLQEERDSWDR